MILRKKIIFAFKISNEIIMEVYSKESVYKFIYFFIPAIYSLHLYIYENLTNNSIVEKQKESQ